MCYIIFESTLIKLHTVYRENKINTVDKNSHKAVLHNY